MSSPKAIYKKSKIYNNELLAEYRNKRYESDDLWYDLNHNLIDEDEFNKYVLLIKRWINECQIDKLKEELRNETDIKRKEEIVSEENEYDRA